MEWKRRWQDVGNGPVTVNSTQLKVNAGGWLSDGHLTRRHFITIDAVLLLGYERQGSKTKRTVRVHEDGGHGNAGMCNMVSNFAFKLVY